MSRREVGRWPDDVVVKLIPGDDARLAIEGEHPDLTLEFRRADGTALPALAPTDVSVERTLWALSAVEVAGLAGVASAAFRRRETTLMAGPVWWRDRWRGWGAGTDGAVRLVVGPRGPMGPPGDWSLVIDASDDEGVTLILAEGSNLAATEDAEGVTLTTV